MALPVHARDLRVNIREYGFENGLVKTLEDLLGEFTEHRQRMKAMTEVIASMADNIDAFLRISEGMKNQIEDVKRMQGEQDGQS